MGRLRLLAGLVGRADLLPGLIEDTLGVGRIGAGGGQFQVLLICLGAARRQDDLLSLGVDGCVPYQTLPLEVVEQSVVGIGGDGLFRGSYLRLRISLLEEDHSLVLVVETSLRGVDLGSGVEGFIGLGNLALTGVGFAQTALRETLNFSGGLLRGGFNLERLLE